MTLYEIIHLQVCLFTLFLSPDVHILLHSYLCNTYRNCMLRKDVNLVWALLTINFNLMCVEGYRTWSSWQIMVCIHKDALSNTTKTTCSSHRYQIIQKVRPNACLLNLPENLTKACFLLPAHKSLKMKQKGMMKRLIGNLQANSIKFIYPMQFDRTLFFQKWGRSGMGGGF